MAILKALVMVLVANGAPVVAWVLMRERLAHPLDMGCEFFDGRPFFGPSKTMRGAAAAMVGGAAAAALLGFSATLGAFFGALAVCGDLFSSFLKRRMAIASSDKALGLDQVPEALVPLAILHAELGLGWIEVVFTVVAFLAVELWVSPVLFRWHLRKRPY